MASEPEPFFQPTRAEVELLKSFASELQELHREGTPDFERGRLITQVLGRLKVLEELFEMCDQGEDALTEAQVNLGNDGDLWREGAIVHIRAALKDARVGVRETEEVSRQPLEGT